MVPTLDFDAPTTGLEVQAFGFPMSEVEEDPDGGWLVRHQAVGARGRVGDVYQLRRDAGMLKFPCFEMDLPIESGMSGGPVFDASGYLRGIVSSSVTPHLIPSYGSTLWPTLGLLDPRPDSTLTLRGLVERGLVGGIHFERYVPTVGPDGKTVVSAT
jgi:hypothetical protein